MIHGTEKEENKLQLLLLLIGYVDRIRKSFLSGFPLLVTVSLFSVFTLRALCRYNAELCFSLTHLLSVAFCLYHRFISVTLDVTKTFSVALVRVSLS